MDNCARIEEYVRGYDRLSFERDRLTREAVERCLERIREAAFRLGDQEALLPDQPRNDIRGMGNRLRHAYDRLNLDIAWDIVERDLPKLPREVHRLLEHRNTPER